MSNDLMINGNANLPAHAQAQGTSNLAQDMIGQSYPRLTFKGNRFRVKIGGEERVLGNTQLPVIILEANPHVSRIYFATAWDGETVARPDCASSDGEVPLASISEPQASKCNVCPMNEKGSAVTDTGGKTRACSFYKRTVVLLVDEPALGPLVADVKAMSMFGQSKADKGEFSLRDYAKRLDQNKVLPHAVVTQLEFDTDESVPKILFKAIDYTSAEFHEQHVAPLMEGGELLEMVSTDDINTGTDEDAPAQSGFRDKLLEGDAPNHAATEAKPEPKQEEAKPEPKPSQQDAIDAAKVDLKLAIEAEDYASAADIKALIAKMEAQDAKQDEPEKELSPQQKAAITRKKNLAKKKAEEEAATKGAAVEVSQTPEAGTEDVKFDDELEDALSEFGF